MIIIVTKLLRPKNYVSISAFLSAELILLYKFSNCNIKLPFMSHFCSFWMCVLTVGPRFYASPLWLSTSAYVHPLFERRISIKVVSKANMGDTSVFLRLAKIYSYKNDLMVLWSTSNTIEIKVNLIFRGRGRYFQFGMKYTITYQSTRVIILSYL